MTIAYFDGFAGLSGDMILGALIDAGGDRSVIGATVDALRLGDEVRVDIRREHRGHVGGTRVVVTTHPRNERTMPAIRALVEDAGLSDEVKGPAIKALGLLSKIEADLHGVDESNLHLHELGGADTLVDLVGGFWLLHTMKVGHVYASPLPAPRGRRGGMPLPAPASVRVLAGTGAVFEASDESIELVTPTGAAMLSAAAVFKRPPLMLHAIGYGIGSRDTPGNALAVWIGEEVPSQAGVTVIETNLDDMAPNVLAALAEDLMAAGALDVTVTAALMKKGRLGHLLAVMAQREDAARLSEHILRHSSTLGVRLTSVHRVLADRRILEIETELGPARVKVKELGGRAVEASPEYEDCRRLAKQSGRDLRDVMRLVGEAARRELRLD
jgi:pyridinium-3,5-bisthiocarboxylic acid mononucleotide nickel chelatase